MFQFASVSQLILLFIYPFEAIFFAIITRNCFIDKMPVRKAVALLLISPAAAHWITFFICHLLVPELDNTHDYLMYSGINTLLLAVTQLLFLLCYIKITHARNRSIALFMYLCCAVLVPGIDTTLSIDFSIIPLIVSTALMVSFDFLTVRPLSENSREEQLTNPRLFITLPIIAFIYKTIVLFLGMYNISVGLNATEIALKLIAPIKTAGEETVEGFKDIIRLLKTYNYMDPLILYISDVFIVIVLMVAFSVIARNVKYMNETKKAHGEVKMLAVEMMEALAHTIDAKDKYTIGHSVRVAKYSRMIAEKMGLSAKECENVYYYGLLHDLGKIGIPNEIINSPAKLTDEEYAVIKKHPQIGYNILSEIHSRPDLTIGARWHHERYDGKGYPDGKRGTDIPLLARIIAVADSYDAMTSNRSYRSYLPQDKVRAEIENNAGAQFDPEIAKIMLAVMDEDTDYKLHE